MNDELPKFVIYAVFRGLKLRKQPGILKTNKEVGNETLVGAYYRGEK